MFLLEKIDTAVLEGISRLLADEVTHAELSVMLREINLRTDIPGAKWSRILDTLIEYQNHECHSNNTIRFIVKVLQPARFVNYPDRHKEVLLKTNKYLAFVGLEIDAAGNILKADKVSTLDEAEERVNSLKAELQRRYVHKDVLKHCKSELLDKNYFHCVLEASKSVAHKIRDKTKLDKDGAELFDIAFSIQNPLLALSTLQTSSEQNEQKGFVHFLKGIFGMFRNVQAHTPKILWATNRKDAVNALMIISYAHERLDEVIIVPQYEKKH